MNKLRTLHVSVVISLKDGNWEHVNNVTLEESVPLSGPFRLSLKKQFLLVLREIGHEAIRDGVIDKLVQDD